MSDHNIENMLMSGIWAMGQDVNNYFHSPNSGLESCSASDPRLVITKKRSCCFNSSTACIFILKLLIGYRACGSDEFPIFINLCPNQWFSMFCDL